MTTENDNGQSDVDEQEQVVEKQETAADAPQRKWGPQIVGAMIGAFIFLIAGGIVYQLGWVAEPANRWWLWGAVIGGLFGSGDSLNHSGKILTKKDNKWLNIFVALLGMVVLVGFFMGISSLIGWIIKLLKL